MQTKIVSLLLDERCAFVQPLALSRSIPRGKSGKLDPFYRSLLRGRCRSFLSFFATKKGALNLAEEINLC